MKSNFCMNNMQWSRVLLINFNEILIKYLIFCTQKPFLCYKIFVIFVWNSAIWFINIYTTRSIVLVFVLFIAISRLNPMYLKQIDIQLRKSGVRNERNVVIKKKSHQRWGQYQHISICWPYIFHWHDVGRQYNESIARSAASESWFTL